MMRLRFFIRIILPAILALAAIVLSKPKIFEISIKMVN